MDKKETNSHNQEGGFKPHPWNQPNKGEKKREL